MKKIDLKKANNRVEWSFLVRIMKALGFNEKFRDLVHSYVGTIVTSFLLNDNITRLIKPGRGLGQGDLIPFALYHFF